MSDEDATVYVRSIRRAADGHSIEVQVNVLQGDVETGMFLWIPLNRMLDVTFEIQEVHQVSPHELTLVLNCDGDSDDADIIQVFHFEDATPRVTHDGEK
jgi:hypothetical protein